MSIEKRLERLEAIVDARGLDWDHPRVEDDHFADANKMVVEEPPKKWRILEPGEVVRKGDWVNMKKNAPSDPPDGLGWRLTSASVGLPVLESDGCVFARPVADEPAKEAEPEHPAGQKPDPGEGYRLLSKDPPEDLRHGDEFFHSTLGRWSESIHAGWGYKRQDTDCWYRRKIEQPKDEYREPVLPDDLGKWAEFSQDGINWTRCKLRGCYKESEASLTIWSEKNIGFRHCRIKKDA